MQGYLKLAFKGFKVAACTGGATILVAFAYLQYTQYKLGFPEIDHQKCTSYYIQQQKMNPTQANRMYYWILIDIAVRRIVLYHKYSSYCSKLDNKIITPAIRNYENQGLIGRIDAYQAGKQMKVAKKLFQDVSQVRKKNIVNLQNQQYIVKQLQKDQRHLSSRKLVNVSEQKLKKISKIHEYFCQAGSKLQIKEVQQQKPQIPNIESKQPGDWLYKILCI